MKNAILITFALVAAATAHAAPLYSARDANIIPGQYIVVLEETQFAPPGLTRAAERRREIAGTADLIATEYRGQSRYVFSESLTGFSVNMSAMRARRLASDPRVALVVPDTLVASASENVQANPPSWGLDRLDQRDPLLDDSYGWYAAENGTDVHVYVLDTGIRSTHVDFDGRVDTVNSFNAYLDGNDVNDCNGHGTHVGGIIGGAQYGVAKNAILHPVRVLTCSGAGSLSAVIAGVDWITNQVLENQHPAVASMSLSTNPSDVLDNAIRASIAAGVTYVAAAGNSADSACLYSPARIDEVITVGATTMDDTRMPNSNFGDCVDIYAPGDRIASTFNRSDTDSTSMSGTSMAAPHVAGTAALLLAQSPASTPADVAAEIVANANSFVDEFGTEGTSALVYSMIELDTGPVDGGLEFISECSPRSRRCVFTASLPPESGTVERYYWDFGGGSTFDHKRAVARHGFRNESGSVTVILAVELTDGGSFMISQEVALPF